MQAIGAAKVFESNKELTNEKKPKEDGRQFKFWLKKVLGGQSSREKRALPVIAKREQAKPHKWITKKRRTS